MGAFTLFCVGTRERMRFQPSHSVILLYSKFMKKLILIVILSLLSAQSLAGSCPQGSEVIRTVSPDGSYFLSSCATMEEIRIQKEDAFLKKQDLTTDSLEQLIMASVKLGISSLEAIYDVDGNLLNTTELIDELMSVDAKMSNEMHEEVSNKSNNREFEDVVNSYIKLKNMEIKDFDKNDRFDKKSSVTDWEKNSTLDC